MRKISLFLLLVSLFVFFSSSLSAAPATKGICEDLKAKGVTKGLFGLCVAYCEAGANSERVLENYNRKKKNSDPAMPCLADTEPTLSCECWNTLTESQIGEEMLPSSCTVDPFVEATLYYQDGWGGEETLFVSAGMCFHYNSVTDDFKAVGTLDKDEENVCHEEILLVAEPEFRGDDFDCLPDPAP